MTCSYHADVVTEILRQLDEGKKKIAMAKTLGIVCDWSVSWMWEAFNAVNHKHIVQKVRKIYFE